MVAVQEGAVFIEDRSVCGGASRVGVPSMLSLGIDARQEGVNGCRNIIGPAEQAHDAGLFRGVSLTIDLPDPDLCLNLSGGPQTTVLPGVIRSIAPQHLVGAEHLSLLLPEHILPVTGAAGPVHESAGLEAGDVQLLEADVLRDLSGDGLVLLHRHRAVQGEEHPQSGLLRCVGVCGVAGAGPAPERGVLPGIRPGVIQVQSHQAPVPDVLGFTSAPVQSASHKAADILDLRFVGFAHGTILAGCLVAAVRLSQLLKKRFPCVLGIVPACVFSAPADGNQHWLSSPSSGSSSSSGSSMELAAR